MTERQEAVLAAIIEQYAEIAVPVGSVTLAKLFNVSSATIRAEMARLEEMGFITHPHTSSGRVPTDKGYRWFVNSLNAQNAQDVLAGNAPVINRTARAIDTRVRNAGEPDQAIRSAVRSLVELTQNVGLATIGDSLYVRGLVNLFDQPEMEDFGSAREVASLLDNLEPWLKEAGLNRPLSVYIGRENPIGKSSGCALIISRFRSPYSDRSYIGVLGPTRQDYRTVINLVGHTGKMLETVFN
ncbi:MAG TPA: transcriptional regulator [Candidatus Saccharimonadales bacterium]